MPRNQMSLMFLGLLRRVFQAHVCTMSSPKPFVRGNPVFDKSIACLFLERQCHEDMRLMLIPCSPVCFRFTATDPDRAMLKARRKCRRKANLLFCQSPIILPKPDAAESYAILSGNDERETVDPLAASSRNACNAIAARWYQCMPRSCLLECVSSKGTMQRRIPGPALRIPKNARSSSQAGQDLDAIYPQTCSQVESEQALASPRVFHQVRFDVVPEND